MTACTKPDRDVPALVCGYPMPCPHHVVVIEEADLEAVIPTVAWLAGHPMLLIGTVIEKSMIEVKAAAHYTFSEGKLEHGPRVREIWRGQRLLPLTSPMRALRDAYDELTREGHVALEDVTHPRAAPCGKCGGETGIFVSPLLEGPVFCVKCVDRVTQRPDVSGARANGQPPSLYASPPGFRACRIGQAYYCPCGASHDRGPVDGARLYRCLQCGESSTPEMPG